MKAWTTFQKALPSGICIGIGGTVYLSCSNAVVGSVLFALGLFYICVAGLNLYTGKIGYILENKNDPNCLWIWLGNFVGSIAAAALIRLARPALYDRAHELILRKLDQAPWETVILGFFCGILMYIAVDNFRVNETPIGKYLGIFLCVPVFILSGFEHSIADMFYCALGVSTLQEAARSLAFLLVVTVANSAGAILFRMLVKPRKNG